MKNAGSIFEYEDARNRDLIRAYRELLASPRIINLADIYREVVNMPSERFWVSEERASIVVSDMLKGRSIAKMRPNKREMFGEIFRRVVALREERPGESVYNLTFTVVTGPAPKFYLTPASAKVIINKIEKQWYEERKRKYRHLFM